MSCAFCSSTLTLNSEVTNRVICEQNSPPRITPNGQPPRFSARYKGAELFVRKQNNIYQPTVPSITSSSTTPVTPVEVRLLEYKSSENDNTIIRY